MIDIVKAVQEADPSLGTYVVVLRTDARALDVDVPHAGPVEARHRVCRTVPPGPLAGDLDLHGVGGPDAEGGAVLAGLRAEHPPELLVAALTDQVEVELARGVRVGGGLAGGGFRHDVSSNAARGMASHPGRLRAS